MCAVAKLLATRELTCLTSKFWRQRVYMLGTAHVSAKSVVAVTDVMEHVRPRAVMVELCDKRRMMLTMDDTAATHGVTTDDMTKIVKRVMRGELPNTFTVVYSIFVNHIAKMLGTKPGAEFVAASKLAEKQGNCVLVLGDRDVSLTVARFWSGLVFSEKTKLILSMIYSGITMGSMGTKQDIEEEVERMKRPDSDMMDEAMAQMGKELPWLVEAIINERDLYMAATLRDMMANGDPDGGDVVAVVGAGHVKGIVKLWEAEESAPGTAITDEKLAAICLRPSNAGGDGTIRVADLQHYAKERAHVVRAALARAAEARKEEKG